MREYLVDLNATQAYVRAGYSENNADKHSHQLMRDPSVKAAIDKALLEREVRVEITADRVLKELYRTAFADMRQAFEEDGSLKPIHEIPEEIARAISAIQVDELFEGRGKDRKQIGVTRTVRFWDKLKALELLGKHLKLYTDRVELSADDSFAEILKAARERSARR